MSVPIGLLQGPLIFLPAVSDRLAPLTGDGLVWTIAQRLPNQCSSGAHKRHADSGVFANGCRLASNQIPSFNVNGVPSDSQSIRFSLRHTRACQPTIDSFPNPVL